MTGTTSGTSPAGVDRCPNCSQRGHGHAGVPEGDISECPNGNCSVYLYWNNNAEGEDR